ESLVGVVAVGYADGLHRTLSNRMAMTFRNKKVKGVGTICMDYCLVDLTPVCGLETPEIGERVVVFGGGSNETPVTELAAVAQTIPYELLTSIGQRVPRRYVE